MQAHVIDRIVDACGPREVVDTVRPYLSESRRRRIEELLDRRISSIEVAIESPAHAHNAAAVVRSAEALGVVGVHVISAEHEALTRRRTTKGAHHWVWARRHDDLDSFLAQTQGAFVLAGAWPDAPVALEELPLERPLCLLFGNEHRGLSPRAREACALGFRVPMVGMSESLNVSVCAAIAMYVTTARKRAAGIVGDLSPATREALRARHYLHSVDGRLVEALFDPAAHLAKG